MKTLKEIKELEDDLRRELREAERSARAGLNRELAHLKMLRLYLETEPDPEFLKRQLNQLETQYKVLEERFSDWRVGKVGGIAELQARYRSETGMAALRTQIKTLTYLLEP